MQKGIIEHAIEHFFDDSRASDSTLPCFAALGEQTAENLRERFQPALTHSLVGEYVDRLIVTSLGSAWTRLYDSVRFHAVILSRILTSW